MPEHRPEYKKIQIRTTCPHCRVWNIRKISRRADLGEQRLRLRCLNRKCGRLFLLRFVSGKERVALRQKLPKRRPKR